MSLPAIPDYPMPSLPATVKVQWQLDPARTVLLVHDMQRYFAAAFGPDNTALQACIDNIQVLLAAARRSGVPIVYTAQPGDQHPLRRGLLGDFWGTGLSAGPQTQIVAELCPEPGDIVLTKWRYSAFARTDLREILHRSRRDQLLITGVYAHLGCQATAVDAFMHDVQPFFVGDATADFGAAEHAGALEYVARGCGRVISTAQAAQRLHTEVVEPVGR